MFDDGYNRKKSKKRKKKQSGDKEKKPKIEKSKKNATKFNVQSIVKLEVKNETHIPSDFEYLPQENIDEFPVPQGSYNDKIIIDSEEDPLKIIDNPLEIIEKVKKKRKHSKHSEQKKLKSKHVSKSKRKHDNLTFMNMPTSDMYNINIIPGDYNLMPVSVSISNELNKKTIKTINKTNINQLTNHASIDNRKDMAKSVSIVENRPTVSSNDKSDFSKMAFTNIDFEKNSYAMAQDTNISCQNKTSRCLGATHQIKQLNINYKYVGASAENRSIIRKNLIKAPRLVLPNTSPIRINSQIENQQTSTMSKIDTNNVIDAKNPYFCLSPSSQFHKPPILKNETEAQCTGTNNMIKSPPSLEISQAVPTDAHVSDTNYMLFNAPSHSFNCNTSFKGIRIIKKTPSTSDGSEKCMKTIWQNNPYSSKLIQENALSDQDFNQISSLANISPISKDSTIIPHCPTYLPPSFMPNYVQNTDTVPPVMNVIPAPAGNSKQTMPKVTKSASRQRGTQKGVSRRKPSAKSNKSNNSASSITSQATVTSTSVGTQINSPIDSTWNLSDPNVQSRITNIQSTLHENEHTNISDNKAQSLQDLQRDNICLHSLASKVKTPSVSKKKPKEKKATTRRKQPMILPTPMVPVSSVPAAIVASETVIPAVAVSAVASSVLAPVDVVPAAAATMAVAPAPIAPATITSVTTPAVVAPTTVVPAVAAPETVAPVIEAKDQSTTQSADAASQVCNQLLIIPGHISEMIYPNIPNNELMKAFNNYWSAQVSHCAICATFASSTSGNSRMMPPDWKYCKSTTLPESTPIWVRK